MEEGIYLIPEVIATVSWYANKENLALCGSQRFDSAVLQREANATIAVIVSVPF
jgi:hypothetical protein